MTLENTSGLARYTGEWLSLSDSEAFNFVATRAAVMEERGASRDRALRRLAAVSQRRHPEKLTEMKLKTYIYCPTK